MGYGCAARERDWQEKVLEGNGSLGYKKKWLEYYLCQKKKKKEGTEMNKRVRGREKVLIALGYKKKWFEN